MATTVKQGYPKTFAVTLSDVANPTGPIAIDKLFTIDNIKATAAYGDAMDQIWRWDTTANGWAKYGYMQNPRMPSFKVAAWRKYNGKTTTDFADLTEADKIAAGEGFLYKRGGSADLTLPFKPLQAAESTIYKVGGTGSPA